MENSFNFDLEPDRKEVEKSSGLDQKEVEKINAFVSDLKLYDYEHSEGNRLGSSLATLIFNIVGEDSAAEEIQKKIEKSITPYDIITRHSEVLEKYGLYINSSTTKGDIDLNEQYHVGEIEIHFSDVRKFTAFLKTLSPNDAPSIVELLNLIAKKIQYQFKNVYNTEHVDDRLLEFLTGYQEIINEYKRLNVVSDITEFEKYLPYLNSGYLREYVWVDKAGYTKKIGEGYNLSTYHIDPTGIEDKWEKYFNLLQKIQQNNNALPVNDYLKKYGLQSIAYAIKDTENKMTDPSLDEFYKNVWPEIIIKLKKYKERINSLS